MATRNVNNLFTFYSYLVKKERGVFILPSQFNANMDAAQLDCVEEWFAPYGETQQLHDALRSLRIFYQFTSDIAGFVTFPSDYIHLLGQPYTVTGSTANKISFKNEDEVAFEFTSQLRPISNSYPIAVDTNVGFSIFPQQTQIGFLWYLKRPATITFAFTQVGRVITYDAANSIQPDFSDVYINHILSRALWYAGINMSEQEISNFAQQYNKETPV